MIGAFGVGLALGARAGVAERTRAGLTRVFGRRLGPWLERNAGRFRSTDDHLLRFFERERGALVLPLLLYSAGWAVRGLEVLLFLRLLGVDVSFVAALVLENTMIVVRSAAVPVPGGLGVQDIGYALFLKALAVPGATTVAVAFVLLKRGKDLFYILLGFALLSARGSGAKAPLWGTPMPPSTPPA
jgi:uncharacterized membrane protein YbhN (UPF0104 family)